MNMLTPWAAPEITSAGRLPMHAVPHEERLDLDGTWDFQLLPRPDAPWGERWREITVPGCWTMQDTGDLPRYTNVRMPFDASPPHPPLDNPTGVYRRTVVRPPAWSDRRVVLHIGAAESVLLVDVNGVHVGISKDSHLAAEFDVTGHLREGTNTLELTVVKWSDASYIEDQDQWWHGGITRSVHLYATAPTYLASLGTHADFDPATGAGVLHVDAEVASTAGTLVAAWQVRTWIEGTGPLTAEVPVHRTFGVPDGPQHGAPPADGADHPFNVMALRAAGADLPDEAVEAAAGAVAFMFPPPAGCVSLRHDLARVEPWTAETPRLYPVRIQLIAPDGTVAEEARVRVGFRRVEVRGADLLVNGRRILVQGVNRHDFDPHTGRTVTHAQMESEVRLLKRFNINAVRTAHYPNDPAFLDLCDELGLYVVDEADIEAHAHATAVCDDPRYLSAFVDRVSRMAVRDRNHPSVIIWSLGNETGSGLNHHAAAGWLRRFDPTRPVQYEGAISRDWHAAHDLTDIVCPMYPPIDALTTYADHPGADRPLIMSEYQHAMGNSNGSLNDYWQVIETTPGLQGGFIWELWDHGLDPDRDGRHRYGGDFGDTPNDGEFCLDGLLFPDRTPHPALFECRRLFSPARIASDADALARGRLDLRNAQTFRGLDWLSFEAHVETADGPMWAHPLNVPAIAAGQEAAVPLPSLLSQALDAPGALALTITVRTAATEPWAPAGTTIATLQTQIRRPTRLLDTAAAPAAVDGEGLLDHPLLAAPPRLSLWRALTDNDRSRLYGGPDRFTRTGLDKVTRDVLHIRQSDTATIVHSRYTTSTGHVIEHTQRISSVAPDALRFDERVVIPDALTDIPRLGIVLETTPGFEQVSWLGLGPHETYPDRKASGLFGRWNATVADLAVPYIRPQENGGRADVSELTLTHATGTTLRFTLSRPCQVNVAHQRTDDLETATHSWQLPTHPETVVHLDIAHRGLGTASVGPDALPPHIVGPGEHTWSWQLETQTPTPSHH